MLKTKKAAQRAANNLTCRSQNNIFSKKTHPKWFNEPPTTFLRRKQAATPFKSKKQATQRTAHKQNSSQTHNHNIAEKTATSACHKSYISRKRRTKKKHQSCLTERGPSHKTNQTPRKNHTIKHVNVSRQQPHT